jgi:hypothetical protein
VDNLRIEMTSDNGKCKAGETLASCSNLILIR